MSYQTFKLTFSTPAYILLRDLPEDGKRRTATAEYA